MANVELLQVSKRFGDALACDHIDLHVTDQDFVTLLGPSGCGKSTTLNLIAGLDDVSSGEIRMDGQRVNELTPYERDVAMVFQQYALYPHMTVAENIGFTMRLRKRPKDEIRQRVAEVADLLELTPYLDRLPRELSGGQQQRVAIGRAVIRQPKVFLFDEPFSNLDAALRVRMRTEIKDLHLRLGATSIFVTHDQEEAMSISNRIAVMRAGRVEQYGTPNQVYGRPASRYVAEFIGSPRMAIFRGELIYQDGVLRHSSHAHTLAIQAARPPANVTGVIDLGVRPEHVRLGSGHDVATVRVVQPIGPETHVTLGWPGTSETLTARVPGLGTLSPGEQVRFSLDTDNLHWFDASTGSRLD